MRQSLTIAFAFLFGGCSLIYNPSNLGQPSDAKIDTVPIDVPPDVEIIMPANPADLALSEIYPATVDEGRGSNGGTQALFVIRGSNFVSGSDSGLAVSLTPMDGGMPLVFTTTVAADHNFIALALAAPVDTACDEGATHAYTLGVTETDATAQTLSNAIVEKCHNELLTGSGSGGTTLATAAMMPMYSEVKVTNNLTITGASSAIIQSAGGIEIDGTITANASGSNAGPGGYAGGAIGANGGGAGGGKGGLVGGGGAGFSGPGTASNGTAGGAMIGDPPISSYAINYASGGGGSGTLVLGAVGGGGGGTIELTAHGDVTIGAIQARGGAAGGTASGAGAGGLIVVRAIGGTTHGAATFDVSAGASGTAGSSGRTRIDGMTDPGITANYYGPGFAAPVLVSTQQDVTVNFTGEPGAMLSGIDETRHDLVTSFSFDVGPIGNGNLYGAGQASVELTAGYNTVCVYTGGVTYAGSVPDIAEDCIEMAFLP